MQRERQRWHGWAGLLGLELLRAEGRNPKGIAGNVLMEAAREGKSCKIQDVKTVGVGSRRGDKAGEHEVLQEPTGITWPAMKWGVK